MAGPARILWFRRDLRLTDHPALLQALGELSSGDEPSDVVPLFVVDPTLWDRCGSVRRAYLAQTLAALDADLRERDGRLVIRVGSPDVVVPAVAAEVGARSVHVSADFAPYGKARDERVERALQAHGIELVRTGSPYAVAPGQVRKPDGDPYRVFTPFYRAWQSQRIASPAAAPSTDAQFLVVASDDLPSVDHDGIRDWPAAGEGAALDQWKQFRADAVDDYSDQRDRPDLPGTSEMSAALRWGAIHPRTLLADLDDSPGASAYARELAWREFYADVLHHQPHSAHHALRVDLAAIETDEGTDADARFDAWTQGRTGYPIVDAGMRQLRAEGWMHNRVRMITASFLVKDLHLPWTRGARWFLTHLRDGDVASNQHGWQWVAGTGTDAAPYFRIFNPVTQGLRFDPAGDYVRAYVPELRGLSGPAVHEPWRHEGATTQYPAPIVDHAEERQEALRRLKAVAR